MTINAVDAIITGFRSCPEKTVLYLDKADAIGEHLYSVQLGNPPVEATLLRPLIDLEVRMIITPTTKAKQVIGIIHLDGTPIMRRNGFGKILLVPNWQDIVFDYLDATGRSEEVI